MSGGEWRRNVRGDALFECERLILDASDDGEDVAAIAARLGLSESYVRRTVSYYNDGLAERARFESMARAGSARLAAAINALGRTFA